MAVLQMPIYGAKSQQLMLPRRTNDSSNFKSFPKHSCPEIETVVKRWAVTEQGILIKPE